MGARTRVTRTIGSGLLNIAALGGLVCIVLVILAFFFNITLIMFKTGSMSPTIPTGSLAVVREIPASDIEIGDVLTVDRPGMLPVTHRVTSISGEGASRTITMKGDANEAEDPAPYTVTEARRVLFSVPGLARIVVWFSNPLVLGAITIATSVLVTWAFWPKAEREDPREREVPREAEVPREHGRHRALEGSAAGGAGGAGGSGSAAGGVASGAGGAARIGGAALAAMLVAGALISIPAAPANAAGRSVPGLPGMPGLLHTEDEVVTQGSYLTLTSIGDAEAMANMQPDVPVLWQVGVRADAPEPGIITLSLEAAGSSELGLSLEIRSCSVRWLGELCSGEEMLLQSRAPVQLGSGSSPLTTMPASEERWILVSAMVPPHGNGAVSLALRAEGRGDTVVVRPGALGTIARTGADASPLPWLGVGAILAGLLAAGAATLVKRGEGRGAR